MKKRYEINMTKGPLLPELLQFILPLMLSSMLQIAFNAADLIVVGHKHLEGWAARWWRGATSPALIEHAHCSVLVVITH